MSEANDSLVEAHPKFVAGIKSCDTIPSDPTAGGDPNITAHFRRGGGLG